MARAVRVVLRRTSRVRPAQRHAVPAGRVAAARCALADDRAHGAARLMVPELEDMPHDRGRGAARRRWPGRCRPVVRASRCGRPGRSLRANALRGRRSLLSIVLPPETCQVGSIVTVSGGPALETAGRRGADAERTRSRALPRARCVASPQAVEQSVVADRAGATGARGRVARSRPRAAPSVSLVLVDAASFNGRRAAAARVSPRSCGCRRGGVPVAAVQRGTDLAAELSGLEEARAASG